VSETDTLEYEKLGHKEKNYQPANVISDVIKMVNAILNSPKKVSLMNLSLETGSDWHLKHSEEWLISCE